MAKQGKAVSAAKQLASFIAKFDPKIAKQIRDARKVMRKRYPAANELVYDNYNFFVIGYSTTERPSDCMFSLAANAKGIGLSFYYGSTLPDPHKILLGSGNQNRFVRLPATATLSKSAVKELMHAAVAQADPPLPSSGDGKLIIRSIAAKQRPRKST
ncbi:MAG TPA: hypothetical protein VMI10_06405 [Terriglobales bacterium]|nr:hypothetical protein [Terriglobales bacterium]